ncbi:MAG: hypothetical protein AAF183_23390 [Pseudomonadota bacterium]
MSLNETQLRDCLKALVGHARRSGLSDDRISAALAGAMVDVAADAFRTA